MIIVFIIGPAGSGKSTLTNSLIAYTQNRNAAITPISINLDPAVQKLPYIPDIDVQDYINVQEVIEETGLGPNGAIIEATDRMIDYLDEIQFEVDQFNDPEFVFIDTPGQMELFAFRDTGPKVADALNFGNRDVKKMMIFCYDAKMCLTPNGFISNLLLATSVQYRFTSIPQLNLLTKMDLISEKNIERVMQWVEDPDTLEMDIPLMERGMLKELTLLLERSFTQMGSMSRLLPVSAINGDNIDSAFGIIENIMGEDSSPYY